MKTLVLTEKQAEILAKRLGKDKMAGEGTEDFQLYIIFEKLIDLGVNVKLPSSIVTEGKKP